MHVGNLLWVGCHDCKWTTASHDAVPCRAHRRYLTAASVPHTIYVVPHYHSTSLTSWSSAVACACFISVFTTMSFNAEDDIALVENVKINQALYDINHESYNDSAFKGVLWIEISMKIGKTGNIIMYLPHLFYIWIIYGIVNFK